MPAPPEAPPPGTETLRRLRVVRGFDDDALGALRGAMRACDVAAGTVLVEEGATDRALYVLESGEVRIERGGVELGRLGPGETFGELTLLVGGRRSASAVALTPVSLLVLDEAGFDRLTEEEPRLAVRFLRHMVAATAGRLAHMNSAVGTLLAERSLARRLDVVVRLDGGDRTVPNGTRLQDILPTRVGDAPVVAALVDGRARPLDAALSSGCAVAPITTEGWEGRRIYRASVGLLLLEAAEQLGISLRLGASLGFAQRLILAADDVGAAAEALEVEAARLIAEDVPLLRDWMTPLEAVDYFRRRGHEETVRLLQTTLRRRVSLCAYGRGFVLDSGPLLPRTGLLAPPRLRVEDAPLVLFDIPGGDGGLPPELRAAADRDASLAGRASAVATRIAAMTVTQERWLDVLDVRSVGDFNHAAITGEVGELIRVAEGFHEKRISQIADAIAARAGELRIVAIAGPSSSGKTTFIRRLRVQLQVAGLRPIGLGLDDYYCDRERTPRAADGSFDFEALEALRLPLLQEHLARLVAGESVRTAHYDFRAGLSHPEGGPVVALGPRDLLLIEGIHGLNPHLAHALPSGAIFRVFVCPLIALPRDRLARLHASDVRLLRRIVRDRHGRAQDAAEAIRRWPQVRDGERKHIFPFQQHADAVFDTGLVYEPSVLKVFAERYLLEVPGHDPAWATAERLLELLAEWVTIYPDHVPPTSLLREFIGGSSFGG